MKKEEVKGDPDWSDLAGVVKNRDLVFSNLYLEEEFKKRIRQVHLSLLKLEFGSVSSHNLFVRGSFARGDYPCDDIDVFHYGSPEDYQPSQWPHTGATRPVSYDHIPKNELKECFGTSMCMSCASLDCLPITVPDKEVLDTITQTRKEIFSTRKSYYLLFRLLEEKWSNNQKADLSKGYDVLKRYPGSKRTIQRIFWIFQAMVPEYQDIVSPSGLLLKASEDKLIPAEVVLSAISVIKTIKKPNLFDKDNFTEAARQVDQWFHASLEPAALSTISQDIPPTYLQQITLAADHQSSSKSLSEVIDHQQETTPPFGKWLMLSTLSGNPSCPSDGLYNIWRSVLGKVAYRCILQNLLYNPSFPKGKVTLSEVEYDPLLLNYLVRLKKQEIIK
jgi:hypothetical protein